ncbi:MAG TPA: cupin domain-containing protein [Actinobacteria bacterium]|nr:cupin domain-containing protein [Actinomycetota bacterium]HDL48912.1 cupin domain-containing protein [Actinomycetota bacterium]
MDLAGEVTVKLKAVTRKEARVFDLPGRDWLHYIGPEIGDARNLTVGYSVFPPNSAPEGHVHPTEEEVIYIVSGKGELVTPEGTAILEPGTCVYIPPGLHHQTVSHGPGPLEMVTSFSPPIVPGSYEKDDE